MVGLSDDADVVVSVGFPKTPPLTADGVVPAAALDAADLNASSVSEPEDLIMKISDGGLGIVKVSAHGGLTTPTIPAWQCPICAQ